MTGNVAGSAPAPRKKSPGAKRRGIAIAVALALPFPALASGIIDNVNGIALDANGHVVRFRAFTIDDEGKVDKLLPDRYQERSSRAPGSGRKTSRSSPSPAVPTSSWMPAGRR